jgi:3-hydroxyacyl-CoA dehydrogenase/enoyl-CoA hydratase/3-hydroxybutyryl-CoA epimerase
VLAVIESGLGLSVEESLKIEANWVADLVTGPVCKNLVRIFQLQEHARKDAVVPAGTPEAPPVARMMLVGTGIMGAGIAELASRAGIEVRMRDVKPEALTRAMQTVRKLIDDRGRRRRAPAAERDGQFARVYPALDLGGLARADFAIEAVVEDLDVKRKVFAELEVRMRAEAILATNTSSLSVNTLAAGLQRPERFCGFHFFNPVHRMPLVEVVRGAKTSDTTLASAVALARRLGKTPVVVADSPGFVVNRVLMPYLGEAMALLEEGYPLAELDRAMRRFGMPMGPFQVLDEVGLDVAKNVAGVLGAAFADRMAPSAALDKLIAAGRLGKKSGRGFYVYRGRKAQPDPRLAQLLGLARERRAQNPDALVERMVLAMVNEAVRCLEEGIARDAGDIDLAMIFGTGFPPFRGGPLRHADALGLPQVVARLNAHRAERGERFAPAKVLVRLADRGGSFTGAKTETPAGAQAALPLGASAS